MSSGPADAPLHVRLRPSALEELVGHSAVVKSLRGVLGSTRVPHAFLFTGPSGVGKTTLARIIARTVGCTRGAIYEVDAARFSTVDATRELLNGTQFAALTANANKCYIVDEIHALSKAAWQTLLLALEEPPAHVWWVLCTTEPDKVPNTIRTRCHVYDLKPVLWEDIAEYLARVVDTERLTLPSDDLVDVIARRAAGSVRQALVYLSTVSGLQDKTAALQLLDTVEDTTGEPVVLARKLVSGQGLSWNAVRELVGKFEQHSPEAVRMLVVNYTTAVLLNTKSDRDAERLLAILQAFSTPCTGADGRGVLLCSIGALLFGGSTHG